MCRAKTEELEKDSRGREQQLGQWAADIPLKASHAAFDSLPGCALKCVVKLMQMSWARLTFVADFLYMLGHRATWKRQVLFSGGGKSILRQRG